jgi:polyhydroxybutyrate depolymerase
MAPLAACGVAAKRTLLHGNDSGDSSGDGTAVQGGGASSLEASAVAASLEGGAVAASLEGGGVPSSEVDSIEAGVIDSTPTAGDAPTPVVPCAVPSLAAGDYSRTLDLDGGSRTYSIHIPPGLSLSTAAPLVFAFHGGGQTAMSFEGFVHLQAKSDSSGFILVEPEGTPALPGSSPGTLDVWNAGNCCELASQVNDNVDDIGFVAAMLASIESEVCVDPKRVFATGFSNGAMLSHRLACQLADRVAAIVTVSGGMGNRNLDVTPAEALFPCSPARSVPVLHIHGTQDACYPFDGGYVPLSAITAEPVMVTVADWVIRNGCSSSPPTTVLTAGLATCLLYPCPATGAVELCTIDGGGHYWPGGDDWAGSQVVCGLSQGVRSMDLIANDVLWKWFVQHPMP